MALVYGFEKTPQSKYMKYLMGGASEMLATSLLQPLDLVKTRMQMSAGTGVREYGSSFEVLAKVLRREGFGAIYNGLSAGLLRQSSYAAARMCFYQMEMDAYRSKFDHNPTLMGTLGMGVLAGAVGAVCANPAELALVRMMADNRMAPGDRRNYRNVADAFVRIVKTEGVTTLWRGCLPTVARGMVINMVQLSSYLQIKKQLRGHLDGGLQLQLSSAMVSGLLTTVASLPLDLAKTRIQQMVVVDGKPEYSGTLDVLAKVVKNEGVFALWKGFTPYLCRVAPHTVVSLLFLEQLNKAYNKLMLGENSRPGSGV
ncbi:hypothetical protein KR009_002616 [Drosophila setifemur]|nr:hypothetical protein KR009_002616 [Drosophila setifemur]